MTPSNAKDDAVEAVALRERASKAVEMLMRLEDTPYFSGGRGPSPVHELRAVIEAQSAAIEAMRAAQPVEDDAVEAVDSTIRSMKHVLDNSLEPFSNASTWNGSSPSAKTSGYSAAKVADWQLRQWLAAIEAMRAAHVTAQEEKEDK
jgi:hypothetical protein